MKTKMINGEEYVQTSQGNWFRMDNVKRHAGPFKRKENVGDKLVSLFQEEQKEKKEDIGDKLVALFRK